MVDKRIPASSGVKKVSGTTAKPSVKANDKPAPVSAAPSAIVAKPKAPTAGADSTIAKGLGTGNLHDIDALLDSAVANTAPAAPAAKKPPQTSAGAVIDEALKFPPMPKDPAEKKAWTMDAYRRVLKAETAEESLKGDWRAGKIDGNALDQFRSKLWNAQNMLREADKDGAVKKEFFEGILPPAKAIIDGLATYPPAPADKAGKEAWLAAGKQKLNEAKAANQLMKDAWFDFQALDFNKFADSGSKIFAFEGQLRRVENELNPPPKPTPRQPGSPMPGNGPLFGNTQGVANAMNKHPNSQLVQAGAGLVLPFAILIDVLDAISRPMIALDKATNPGKK